MQKTAIINQLNKFKASAPKSGKEKLYKLFFNYIVLVPSKKVSRYSIDFKELGLKSPQDYKLFLNNLKKKLYIKDNYYIWKSNTTCEEVFDLFEKAKMSYKNFVYHKKGVPQLKSLYVKIRNGLSHGNYYIKGERIVIWNESVTKNNLNALMILGLNDFYLLFELLIKHKQKRL